MAPEHHVQVAPVNRGRQLLEAEVNNQRMYLPALDAMWNATLQDTIGSNVLETAKQFTLQCLILAGIPGHLRS